MGHYSYITAHPSRARVLSLLLFVLGLWLCCVRRFSFLFIVWSTCRFLCAPFSFSSFFACCRTLASFKAVQNAPIHLHLTQFLCFSMRLDLQQLHGWKIEDLWYLQGYTENYHLFTVYHMLIIMFLIKGCRTVEVA